MPFYSWWNWGFKRCVISHRTQGWDVTADRQMLMYVNLKATPLLHCLWHTEECLFYWIINFNALWKCRQSQVNHYNWVLFGNGVSHCTLYHIFKHLFIMWVISMRGHLWPTSWGRDRVWTLFLYGVNIQTLTEWVSIYYRLETCHGDDAETTHSPEHIISLVSHPLSSVPGWVGTKDREYDLSVCSEQSWRRKGTAIMEAPSQRGPFFMSCWAAQDLSTQMASVP